MDNRWRIKKGMFRQLEDDDCRTCVRGKEGRQGQGVII